MGYMLEQEKNISNEAKAKKADLENILSAIENENYRRDVTPSQWPTAGGEITSYFGGRSNPFGGYDYTWHSGIDIANYYGAPVYAAAPAMCSSPAGTAAMVAIFASAMILAWKLLMDI